MTTSSYSRNTTLGTTYCVLSAVAYTAFYVFQGDVSKRQDSLWITSLQAAVAALLIGAFMAWQSLRGRRVFPAWKEMLKLVVLGLLGQLGGVLLVWAMSMTDAGISTVIGTGIMLASSAILGFFLLGERVSWQQIVAMALITVSVVCFGMNDNAAAKPDVPPAADMAIKGVAADLSGWTAAPDGKKTEITPVLYMEGLAAAGLSGFVFALLTVGIRKMVTSTTSAEAMVFFLNVMGPVALGPLCLYQIGWDKLAHTAPHDLGIMLAAGPFNLIGLLLVTKSLQLISVVRVNVINNGLCTTLVVIGGILFLSESHNFIKIAGMIVSIAGILLISLADPNQSDVAAAADMPLAEPSVTVSVE